MRSLLKIWSWALLAKLVLAAILPLSQDEAYYWVWSKHLQLSYFDHPGMVAWLFSLSPWLESLGQAVRWPSVILGHLTLLIWLLILQESNSTKEDSRSKFFLWLGLSSPLLGYGSLLATPDVPVIFFWSLSCLFLQKILKAPEVKVSKHYFLLGVALGLGFCSKYHIVLFPLSLLLWLVFGKNWRKISWSGVALIFLGGLVFSLPVLIWNYQNQFQSFRFQLDHGLGGNEWEFFWTSSYLLGQFLLLGPVTLWFALKSKTQDNYWKYLAWTPLVFFIFSSFKGVVEVNWPIVSYPAIYFLAVQSGRALKALWWSILPWALVAAIVSVQTIKPFTDVLPDRLVETHYFDPILDITKKEPQVSPLYFSSYQMASRVWWEYKTPAKKLFQMSRHDFFDEIQGAPNAEPHFYVARENWVPWPAWINSGNYAIKKLRDVPPKFELFEVNRK